MCQGSLYISVYEFTNGIPGRARTYPKLYWRSLYAGSSPGYVTWSQYPTVFPMLPVC